MLEDLPCLILKESISCVDLHCLRSRPSPLCPVPHVKNVDLPSVTTSSSLSCKTSPTCFDLSSIARHTLRVQSSQDCCYARRSRLFYSSRRASLSTLRHLLATFMASNSGKTLLAALTLSAATAMAQSQGPTATLTTSPTATQTSSSSSITSSSSTSSDVPLSLWNVANSLLTEYYPSTTLSGVSGLSWPATVTIGSSTYSVHAADPTTTASLSNNNSESSPNSSHNSSAPALTSDKKLGIGIGVAVGAVALIVLAIVLCCMRQRRKSTGSYFKRRATPSITDSEIGGWNSRQHPSDPQTGWQTEHNNRTLAPYAPPMAMHPAYIRHHSSQSTSENNPFFTPEERSTAQLSHHELDGESRPHKVLDMGDPYQRSSSSIQNSRPPTPFSPMMMGATHQQQQAHHNPFSSPEDDEAADIVSPIIPARSPERRHSPMVHYPSWSEVSEFDFGGTAGGRGRASLRGHSSSEDGGDGWRPNRRESIVGRSELS